MPRRIWSEIKWSVEKRSRATVETERAEIGANSPGPSGFQTAAAQFVEAFARNTATGGTLLLLDRLAVWKQN